MVKKEKQPSAGMLSTAVYQTPKGFFAVRSKHTIDWTSFSQRSEQDWEEWDGSEYMKDRELRLDVYKTLEDLQQHISENLYQEVIQALNGDEIEILDL